VAQFADWVGVMYAGKLVELAPVQQIVQNPLHPYSKLLLQSVPGLDEKRARLTGIPGMPPRLLNLPPGCLFAPRCPAAMAHCTQIEPVLSRTDSASQVACHLYPATQPQTLRLEVDA
jgi:peptide/nickel transport system ATP-binding protein